MSAPASERVLIDGAAVALDVRVNRRARRISLRVDNGSGSIVLTLPNDRARAEGLRFAAEKADWIRTNLAALPARVPFAPGAILPLLDVPHRVMHRPDSRAGVWAEAGEIHVSGRAEHLPRRLGDWLKAEARRVIVPRAHATADRLDRRVARISIRDTRSRWGSCSHGAVLSFSWRLLLAPEPVLDYVVAHEAAHLVEMNHSRRFWRLVDGICPGRTDAERWLRRHGPALHRYG